MFRKAIMLMGLLFVFAAPVSYAYTAPLGTFADVKETDWSKESIYSLYILGQISGYPDKTFRPDENVSREAFIKMLVTAGKLDEAAGGSAAVWKDVDTGRWSYPYIQAASRHQLLGWVEGEAFQPEKPISREEVAAAIGMYLLSRQPEEFQADWINEGWIRARESAAFQDDANIKSSLLPSVYAAVDQNIMLGDQTGRFRPGDPLTRREAAAIVYRLLEKSAAANSLEVTGFYAIQSYRNLAKVEVVDRLSLGWAQLVYEGAGNARVETAQGEWKIPPGWEEVIQTAQQHQVQKELLVFYNKPDLAQFLRDEPAQETFLLSVKELLRDERFGFTGITVDFEGLKSADLREPFVQFLQKARAELPNQTLTVAVPPTIYYQGYDLEKIGSVADRVILMAYDFTDKTALLPSAPLPLVNETVAQAVQLIPKEKLVLGISKQANQWVSSPSGREYYQPSIDKVEERLRQPDVSRQFSLPYFLEKITFADSRGQHEIWYESPQSIDKKMWLAKYYGLQGVALWHMGNFTEADWEAIRTGK